MDSTPKFSGFVEPKSNYYRLPNNWFGLLAEIRQLVGSRISSIVKVLEYIIRHTWSLQPNGGLSEAEIRKGKKIGRRRLDSGTQLDARSIRRALDLLKEISLVTQISTNHRGLPLYRVKIIQSTDETVATVDLNNFTGFLFPETNYFKVPNTWTDITAQLTSAATISLVEYLIRHSYGYQNQDGIFLDADEIGNGRRYRDGRRYDDGIQYDHSSVYHAIQEALKYKLIVWTDRTLDGSQKRLYSIRMVGMPISNDLEFLGKLPWETENDYRDWLSGIENDYRPIDNTIQNVVEPIRANEGLIRTNVALLPIDAEKSDSGNAKSIRTNAIIGGDLVGLSSLDANNGSDIAGEMPLKDTTKDTFQNTIENTSSTQDISLDSLTLSAAVVDGNLLGFLYSLGIDQGMRNQIAAMKPPSDYILGWALKVFTDRNHFTNLPGFLVTKYRNQEVPPPEFLTFARLLVEDWLELIEIRSDWRIYGQSAASEYVADIAKTWMGEYLDNPWEKLPIPVNEYLQKAMASRDDTTTD